ncbi:MAG: hypothetical protein Q9163_000020 [Psora crenata]
MPSSPRTPTRRRNSSMKSVDLSFTSASPQSNKYSSRNVSFSRRSSQQSIDTSITPRPLSSRDRNGEFPSPNGFGEIEGFGREDVNGNGLGNLADELAEAWDEDAEGEEVCQVQVEGLGIAGNSAIDDLNDPDHHHPGGNIQRLPATDNATSMTLSPPKIPRRSKHLRQNPQYDGSDYGDDSDQDDTDGISQSLEARMAAIESLARRGTEVNGSNLDNVVQRVAESLRDLPSQSGVENGTSRLITTHTALTSHLVNQTRTLAALAHPLISPMGIPPDLELVEELIPLLATLLVSLPTPTAHCFSSLHSLQNLTADLQSTLTYLSDTIYMARQTLTSGTRKLKSASEVVVEMRREAEAGEEAVRWIEKGDWGQRLASRECARVCGDVVGGFEEVCNGWRRRLAEGLGAA